MFASDAQDTGDIKNMLLIFLCIAFAFLCWV
jgi:hypothetical protein